MEDHKKFTIGAREIGKSKEAQEFKKATIKNVLESLRPEEKKAFGPGDLVTTLEGPYAHKGLMVVEKKDDGMVRIAPAPNTPADVEIHESKLWHLNDYSEALKVALVEEQDFDIENPQ